MREARSIAMTWLGIVLEHAVVGLERRRPLPLSRVALALLPQRCERFTSIPVSRRCHRQFVAAMRGSTIARGPVVGARSRSSRWRSCTSLASCARCVARRRRPTPPWRCAARLRRARAHDCRRGRGQPPASANSADGHGRPRSSASMVEIQHAHALAIELHGQCARPGRVAPPIAAPPRTAGPAAAAPAPAGARCERAGPQRALGQFRHLRLRFRRLLEVGDQEVVQRRRQHAPRDCRAWPTSSSAAMLSAACVALTSTPPPSRPRPRQQPRRRSHEDRPASQPAWRASPRRRSTSGSFSATWCGGTCSARASSVEPQNEVWNSHAGVARRLRHRRRQRVGRRPARADASAASSRVSMKVERSSASTSSRAKRNVAPARAGRPGTSCASASAAATRWPRTGCAHRVRARSVSPGRAWRSNLIAKV